MDPTGCGFGHPPPPLVFKPKLGVLGVENKPKNEVKIQNFPHKIRRKPTILCLRRATLVKQGKLIYIILGKIDAFGRIMHTLYRTQVYIGVLNIF